MKNYKLILISIFLIFLLSINSVSAINENKTFIDGFALKNDTIPWLSVTSILTPFGDKTQVESIFHCNAPQNLRQRLNIDIHEPDTIISEVDFYIDNEKKNFSEYFLLEIDGEKNIIKSIKTIEDVGTIVLKFKYFIKPADSMYYIEQNKTKLKYVTSINFEPNVLFSKFIFRIPTINAHNVKLDFQSSIIKQTDSLVVFAPISKIYETDEYLEVQYIFWNDKLVNEILIIGDSDLLIRINPSETYIFGTKFSIQYETFRVEWLIAIILSSLVAIFGFIGGALWVKNAK